MRPQRGGAPLNSIQRRREQVRERLERERKRQAFELQFPDAARAACTCHDADRGSLIMLAVAIAIAFAVCGFFALERGTAAELPLKMTDLRHGLNASGAQTTSSGPLPPRAGPGVRKRHGRPGAAARDRSAAAAAAAGRR
eukprot:TRINITY_DN56987_c0_g1_i1.p1 TRINITY_DN56987_c0_g1~~TRINITY_DN56987_c0_g1_i1.p1  ORF type:complete len:140 (-),score=32.88 TRINITY_DN56987_c0_g1_i1:218-637(-)